MVSKKSGFPSLYLFSTEIFLVYGVRPYDAIFAQTFRFRSVETLIFQFQPQICGLGQFKRCGFCGSGYLQSVF